MLSLSLVRESNCNVIEFDPENNKLNNQKLNKFFSQKQSDLDLLCPNVLYLLLRSLLFSLLLSFCPFT